MFLEFFYNLRGRGLKVTTHNWLALMEALGQGLQAAGVLEARGGVVDGAGAHHHHQAVVAPVQDVRGGPPRSSHELLAGLADRELLHEDGRGNERPEVFDAHVVGPAEHGAHIEPMTANVTF